jgi:hypothetical protein
LLWFAEKEEAPTGGAFLLELFCANADTVRKQQNKIAICFKGLANFIN